MARKPTSIAPDAAEVDSGWDASDPAENNAKADNKSTVPIEVARPQAQTAPARVSQTSVGMGGKSTAALQKPPADRRRPSRPPEAKVEVALLNERTNLSKGTSGDKSTGRAKAPSSPGDASTSAGPPVLNQWLSEGSENNFHPSQIAHLVIDVMGSETPVPSEKELNTSESEPETTTAKLTEPPRSLPPVVTLGSPKVASRDNANQPSDDLMEPDGWDVSPQAAARTDESKGLISLRAKSPASEPAVPAQKIIPAEGRGKISIKPASKFPRTSDKPRSTPAEKKAPVVERGAHHSRSEGLDSEWAGEFFASNAHASTHVEEYHESDEDIDERHLRLISPEATARRARYRVIVIGLIVAMTLLLAVAVALKLLHKH